MFAKLTQWFPHDDTRERPVLINPRHVVVAAPHTESGTAGGSVIDLSNSGYGIFVRESYSEVAEKLLEAARWKG